MKCSIEKLSFDFEVKIEKEIGVFSITDIDIIEIEKKVKEFNLKQKEKLLGKKLDLLYSIDGEITIKLLLTFVITSFVIYEFIVNEKMLKQSKEEFKAIFQEVEDAMQINF